MSVSRRIGVGLVAPLLALACSGPVLWPAPPAGFLGDYSGLRRFSEINPRSELFIAPHADFSRYEEILLDPVTIWVGSQDELGAGVRGDLERLADRMEAALRSQLGEEFDLVERPGTETLRLRVAISATRAANQLVSVVSKASRGRPGASREALAPETEAFLAGAAIEAEALDALSNRRLAAAVDAQAVEALLKRPPKNWGDLEQACQDWADGTQAALASFRRTARAVHPPG